MTAPTHKENALSSTHSTPYLTQCRADAKLSPMTSETLRGGLTVLFGMGGNIAVFSRPDALLLVDAGWSTEEQQISRMLAGISSLAPSTLINTHWHYDHTDGNAWIHARGALITAHRNTLKRLSVTQLNDVLGAIFPASPAVALPTDIFDIGARMSVGEVGIVLTHYPPAHTDGDISVHFEELDILHTGDTWSNGLYPFIDASTGGHIDGMIQATQTNLRRVSAATVIIPGRGPVGNREQLERSLDMLTELREKVATLKQRGLTFAEVVAGKPETPYEKHFSGSFVPFNLFLSCIYSGV